MIRTIPWVLIFTLGILFWATSPAAQADDAGLRRIDVPADQPDQWPKGVWSAVPREEFTRWMEIIASRKSQPTRSRLSRADYELRIVDGRLEGSFEITLSGDTPEKGELVDLTPVTLPLKRLQWKSGDPAVFGLAADQRQYLWVDGQKRVDEDRLVGECVLTGAALPQSMFFNLSLFPADLSEIRLKVPEGYQLSSSAGVIVRGPDAANRQQTVSSIRLAGTSECEVSLTRAVEKRDSTERLLYEEDLAAIIREDELRFLTTLIVEVPEQRTVEKLRFALPDNFELISATLGADTPLKFSRDSASKDIAPNTGSGIVISLPSPMTGRLRAIRLEGTQPGTALPQVTIPQIDLQDATLLRGRTTITVVSPLQMRGVEQEGYRESGPLTMTADGEVFTFDRQQARARLKLEIRRPIPRFTASSTTLVHGEVDHWRIRSHIDWFVSSGSLQQATITIPPEWQVTQVLGDDEGSRLADWEVQRDGTRASLLQIEFALPGLPGQPRRVSISASRSFATTPKRLPIPSLKPTNAESTEYLIGIRAESAGRPTPAANSRFETTTLPATPDPRILRDVRQLSISLTPQDFLWFRANDPQTAGDIEFRSHLTPLDVTATVLARTHDSPLHEHYVIDVEADGSTPKELLVFITEPGDDIPWSAIHSGTNKPLAAQRAPRALYAEWGYPETGELWQISLGAAAGSKVRIQGSRQRPLEDAVIGLAFVPHASRFRGRVALAWPNDGTLKVDTTLSDPWETPDADLLALFDAEAGDSPAADATPLAATGTAGSPEASVSLMKQQFWEYRGLDSQLSLTTLNKSENPSEQPPAQLHISAQIPATLGGECRYHFEYRLPSNRQASLAGLRLPDGLTLRSLRCDGQVIASEILSPGASTEQDAILWNRLEMDFSGPLESRWLHQTFPLAIPQVPVTILWATLTLQVPPQVEVADVSPPWYTSQFAPPGWSERWFGPLSRSDSQPIFDPMGRAISWMISGEQAAEMTMPDTTRAKPNSRDPRWKTLTFSSPSQDHMSTIDLKSRGNERGRNNLPTMENSSALGEINISFWNMTELRRTCWVLLLGTVLGGVFWISLAPQRAVFALFLAGVVLAVGNPWLGMFAQPLAGSALSGILLLLVIPPRWWQYRDSPAVKNAIPTGSTQSYRLPSGAMGILPSLAMLWRIGFVVTLVACALIGSPVAAQISPSSNPTGSTGNLPPVDNGNTLKPTIPPGTEASREDGAPGNDVPHRDLLVPVDRDGQPSRTLPLVYLHPRTAAMLKASAADTPARIDSLVSRSRIVGQSNPNSIGALRATYDTWVLLGQDSPLLKLPMSGRYLGGRNSVTVDGQPATLLPSTTGGEGLSIPLPPHAGGSNPILHEVALELRAARREVHGGTLFVLPLIPTLLAELSWQTGSSDDSPIIVSPQVAQPSPNGRAASIWLGPTDHLWLKAPGNPGVESAPLHRPAGEGASKLESVDMRAMMSVDHVSISHRSRLWRSADAGTLTMPIPAEAVIRSIRADRMLNWYRKAGIDHDTLTIEFKGAANDHGGGMEELAAEVSVDIDLQIILPNSKANLANVSTSRWTAASTEPSNECDIQLTIESGTEYQVTATPVGITAAPALDGNPGGLQVTSPTPSKVVVRSRRPVGFDIALTPVNQKLRQLDWNLLCRVSSTRLDVEYTTTIESSDLPVYSHRLQIDRRLQLDSVSVEQGGAERLVRVSDDRRRDNGRGLTLLLSSSLTGTQIVRVKGSLPIRNQRSVAIPRFEFDGLPSTPGTLLLTSAPRLTVGVDGGLERLSGNEPGLAAWKNGSDMANEWVGAYRWLPEQSAAITITPLLTSTPATTFTVVDCHDPGTVGLRTWIRLEPASSALAESKYELELPQNLRGRPTTKLTSSWGIVRELEPSSGRFEITKSPTAGEAENPPETKQQGRRAAASARPVILLCEAELPIPMGTVWPLPLPTIDRVSYQNHQLTVLPIDADLIVTNSKLDGATSGPPEWMGQWLVSETGMEGWAVRDTGVEIPGLMLGASSRNPLKIDGRHLLWIDETAGTRGVSRFHFDVREEGRHQLRIAAELTLDTLLVNGKLKPSPQSEGGLLTLELEPLKPVQVILTWRRREPVTMFPSLREMTLPAFESPVPGGQSVILIARPTETISRGAGLVPLDGADLAETMLEGLPPIHPSTMSFPPMARVAQSPMSRERDGLKQFLTEDETDGGSMENPSISMVGEINLPQATRPTLQAQFVVASKVDAPLTQTFQYRVSNNVVFKAAWSFFLVIGGGYFLLRLNPTGLREWLIQHPHAAYALLGLVWWLAFTGSGIGFTVAIVALAASLWQRRRQWVKTA